MEVNHKSLAVRREASKHAWNCLVINSSEADVQFISRLDGPFELHSWTRQEFDAFFPEEVSGTSAHEAAEHMTLYSRYFGASTEAMEALSQITEVSEENIEMAKKKTTTRKATKKTTTRKTATKGKAKAASKTAGEGRKPSAASRFQELILEGKLTDEEIFLQVQKEFGLDDSKRGYVSWYRNYLKKKKGMKNVPGPIKD